MPIRGIGRRGLLQGVAVSFAGTAMPGGPAIAQPNEEEIMVGIRERSVALVEAAAEPLPPIEHADFARFIDRFAQAKVILLGEASHGTDEFYRARAAITERLVQEHGFTIVALEADWPDAARIDAYVRGRSDLVSPSAPFQRFPTWMWRNRAVREFVDRLHALNGAMESPDRRAGVYGLDIYSLPSSMDAVVEFVRRHDPEALEEVRARYGCLAPWVDDLATYGALARTPRLDSCAEEVVAVIDDVLKQRLASIEASDAALFNALQNARVVAASEAYYRAMYEGSTVSWNLRDTHMFKTLQAVLKARGPDAKAVVWAHNSHIGNADATEMGMGGQINIGQLCREKYGDAAVLIGFGTDRGTVTAASEWGGPSEEKRVRPSLPDSWGHVMRGAEPDRFFLDLRGADDALSDALRRGRPERFIGVIYRPETERLSHYSDTSLSREYDGFLWFEETQAVEPLPAIEIEGMPQTYPFAL